MSSQTMHVSQFMGATRTLHHTAWGDTNKDPTAGGHTKQLCMYVAAMAQPVL